MIEQTPTPDQTDLANEEQVPHCCANIVRECIEKTLLVEQYLLPLLQHLEVPGGVISEFKKRWRKASLEGKTLPALRTIARKHHIPILPGMTDQDLRTAILDAEDTP